MTNICKPPKNFDFPDTEQPFVFVWSEEFQCVCYSQWEDRASVLFDHKNVGSSKLQNVYITQYRTLPRAQKTIKM